MSSSKPDQTGRLDVVIFGATGFTGAAAVYESVKLLQGLRWGIAGRNEAKLREVLATVGKRVGRDLAADGVEVLVADVGNPASLQAMAERAKIIVNCCGPYRFFGEPVVKACIAAGTHQLDVSGEPQFIERMQLDYDEAARARGVYIISACGFDSIPADVGTVHAEQQFAPDGVVNSVESYLRVWIRGGHTGGAGVNYGTWESAVHGLAHWSELRPLRAKLFPERLPALQPRLADRGTIHRSSVMNGRWCLPFLGADRSVVMRTQRSLLAIDQKRPIQMRTYLALDSVWHVAALMFFGAVFVLMSRFEWGRKMLLDHPKLFSGGFFSHVGPTEETQRNTIFSMTFETKGWSKKGDVLTAKPDKTVTTRVTGTNPGYGATCVSLLLSATTLLRETAKVPGDGGVLSPGAAFAKTSLIEQLSQNGFTFEVVPNQQPDESKKSE